MCDLPRRILTRDEFNLPRGLGKYDVLGIELENGAKLLLLSAPDIVVAGFGLAVGMGSSDGPSDFLGVPHLLEHMVMLGSKRFPDPNGWQSFVDEQGAGSNASTRTRATHYWATVKPEALPELVDRMIDYIKDPLLDEEYVNKTIEVVHSEAEMRYQEDVMRMDALARTLSNPAHPFHSYINGDNETLAKPGIHEALRKFHEKAYSSNVITAVAISNQPLRAMRELFAPQLLTIPNKRIDRPPGKMYGNGEPMLRPQDLMHYVKAIPVSDGRKELVFEFAITDLTETYSALPHWTVTGLLGQEARGSLTHSLKKKGLISGLLAGVKYSELGQSRLFVTLQLTDSHISPDLIESAGEAIFAYIRLMAADNGPSDALLKERHEAAVLRWENADPPEITSMLEDYCFQMLSFPQQEAFRAGMIPLEDSKPAVRQLIAELRLETLNVFGYTKNFTEADCPLPVEHCDAKYGISSLEMSWVKSWNNALNCGLEEFHSILQNWDLQLPRPNPFVPADTEVKKTPSGCPEFPTALSADPLWFHKLDTTFNVPLVEVHALVRLPCLAHKGIFGKLTKAQREALGIVFVRSVMEAANEDLQCAMEFSLQGEVKMASRIPWRCPDPVIQISISGLHDKAPLLFKTILENITEWSVPDEYIALALQSAKDHAAQTLGVTRPVDDTMLIVYETWYSQFFTTKDLLEAFNSLDVREVRRILCGNEESCELLPDFLHDAQIKGLVAGNVTLEEAEDKYFSPRVWGRLYNPVPLEKRFRSVHPLNMEFVAQNRKDRSDSRPLAYHVHGQPTNAHYMSSAVMIVWQAENLSPEARTLDALIRKWVDNLVFDELRTAESWGYVVNAFTLHNCGVGIRIQSDRKAAEVLTRMLQFVKDRVCREETPHPHLSEASYNAYKSSVLLLYRQPPQSLQDAVADWRREIFTERCDFRVKERQQKFLENLSYSQFLEKLQKLLARPWMLVSILRPDEDSKEFLSPDWIHCVPLSYPGELLGTLGAEPPADAFVHALFDQQSNCGHSHK